MRKTGVFYSMVALALIVVSIIGVVDIYGTKVGGEESAVEEQQSQPQQQQEQERLQRQLQAFASSQPPQNPVLLRLYNLLKDSKPTLILFWPPECFTCYQYKLLVWDQVKIPYQHNTTFVDFPLNTTEGGYLASHFNITGITLVLSYNGTVFGVFYGVHLPPEYLDYLVRILSYHVERGVGE